MLKRRFTHLLVAVALMLSLLVQGTWVLAGTTGSLSGIVNDTGTGKPISGAKVSVTSPSQSASTSTDAGGHFSFVSLAPDTYTVSVEAPGYDSIAQSGINVFADQSQTLTLSANKSLKEIGRVTTRATSDLVKPGTTADVYSINATLQQKVSGVGGGGGLNNAYSAIATVPGAFVPNNQSGYFQTISIRGGDYDQVGYELDGVPVNRSFDNYPSGTASSLGQQELQVYTGAAPANAEGQGLSGFINQVIRSGTYPGFAQIDLGVGGPAYYHKASVEFGGATPDRNFSYYVGLGGYNQDYRYVDQFNGAAYQPYGPILTTTSPTTVTTGAYALGNTSNLVDRDSVINLHVGFPHKNGTKDDLQLLYVNNFIRTYFFSSPNDVGLGLTGGASPPEQDSYQYSGQLGAFVNPATVRSQISPYIFPSSSYPNRQPGSAIPADNRDTYQNDQSIFKLQYQKNFSAGAYLRLYGYSYYSDWLQNGQDFAYYTYNQNVVDGVSPDYELSSHTRGLSGTFADQINSQNLIQLQGSFTTAKSLRDNNTQFLNTGGSRSNFAVLVDSSNPFIGICYNASTGTPVPTNCNTYKGSPAASVLKLGSVYNGGAVPNYSNLTCGAGPCQFLAVENGQFATYNTVTPNFTSFSLTDTYKPTDKLTVNLGLRDDIFQFVGSNTTGSPARQLFFNSFNLWQCVNPQGVIVAKAGGFSASCSAMGPGFTTPALTNVSGATNTYDVFQPRIGLTYSVDPRTVLRASYGRYAQAPNTAFEQYNALQQNSAYSLLGANFYKYGFTTPSHTVLPETSNNYDFSIEHQFKGTDVSFKLTPFYRYTQNQIQTFFLDQASGFVSGLNADRLTARGVEFQLNKGDFGREGLAAQLSFTYTNAYAQYNTFSNGSTVFTGINNDIAAYNQYTSFCANNFSDKRCGGLTAAPGTAAACFTTGGNPDPACAAGSIANPYYNAPVQSLVDPNGKYAPFSLVTGPIGASANSYLVPYAATLIVNYKKGPFAITPSLQMAAGQRYGVPESNPGFDPASGCAALATGTAGDPRYPYGGAGLAANATSCGGSLAAIPNTYTHRFDGIGDFVNPTNLALNLQMTYDVSKKVTLVATLANVINQCFGGTATAWNNGGPKACSYGLVDGGNANPPVGNIYNPGDTISPLLQYPYARSYGVFNTNGNSTLQPFAVYVDAQIKL